MEKKGNTKSRKNTDASVANTSSTKKTKATPKRTVKKQKRKPSKVKNVKTKTQTAKTTLHVKTNTRTPKGNVTKKKKNVQNRITATTSRDEGRTIGGRLAVMSIFPQALSLNIDRLAIQSARFSGIAFVIVGGIFAIGLIHVLFPNVTTDTLMATVLLTEETRTEEPLNTDSTTKSSQEAMVSDESLTPTVVEDATFHFSQDGFHSGISEIFLSVQNATNVTFLAFYREKMDYIFLGEAQLVREGKWKFDFDTTRVEDGQYRLKAIIRTRTGSYDVYHNTYIEINNSLNETVENSEQISDDNELTTREVGDSDTPKEGSVDDDSTRTYDITSIDEETDIIEERPVEDSRLESANVQPKIVFGVSGTNPLSGTVNVVIEVDGAEMIELYVMPRNSSVRRFLGSARVYDEKRWMYTWSTTNTPNGEYELFVHVRNKYGAYESERKFVTIKNNSLIQTETEDVIQKREAVALENEAVHRVVEEVERTPSNQRILEPLRELDEAEIEPDSMGETRTTMADATSTSPRREVVESIIPQEILNTYDTPLREKIMEYRAALRSNDEDYKSRARSELEDIKTRLLSDLEGLAEPDRELVLLRENKIQERFTRIVEDTERTERIIHERIGEEMAKDTDADGITDYDELYLYRTDPLSADTDADGFADGVEISAGYDPLNSDNDSPIVYESPRDFGVIREDLLAVESIQTVSSDVDDPIREEVPIQAIISGRALPNSFVTLYIFSTPIIVTVKADETGAWIYQFDKELEDGSHEMYVGMTDNTGQIVAKSEPFTFIKTAIAYEESPKNEMAPPVSEPESSQFDSQYMIFIVLSVSVVSIGLLLILMGLYLKNDRHGRQKDDELSQDEHYASEPTESV